MTIKYLVISNKLSISADINYEEYDEGFYTNTDVADTINENGPFDYDRSLTNPNYGLTCTFEGKVYADGETFEPDSCARCTCFEGEVTCERNLCGNEECSGVLCPTVDCDNKYIPLGGCCAICPGEIYL